MIIEKIDLPEQQTKHWAIKKFEVNQDRVINPYSFSNYMRGSVPSGQYTKLIYNKKGFEGTGNWSEETIMSDTPQEIHDHDEFIWNARGKVLIAGLGLGLVLKNVAKKDCVEKVTVVEKEQEVIDMVWKYYVKEFGDKIELIHEDIFKWNFPRCSKWDWAWYDIWPTICGDNYSQILELHKKFRNRVHYQRSWCQQECKELYRR